MYYDVCLSFSEPSLKESFEYQGIISDHNNYDDSVNDPDFRMESRPSTTFQRTITNQTHQIHLG